MRFTSVEFLLFFPIVTLLSFIVPHRLRWFVLLMASYGFYSFLFLPHLVLTLITVTFCAYVGGRAIDNAKTERAKKCLLYVGIIIPVGFLFVLKYLPVYAGVFSRFLMNIAPNYQLPVIGPWQTIGISYFIFQAISYQIDIYLEQLRPEKHIGYFALYLSFFPKLLQGPIERGANLLPQFHCPSPLKEDAVVHVLLLFMVGFVKKVVVADRLSMIVTGIEQSSYQGIGLLLPVFLYAFQIYYDFSGYTDMALGCARILNITLTPNFNNPYYAVSVADFWKRWHISFSSWLTDYLFTPLQLAFREKRQWGTALAILITFTICGLWHGAQWTFILWGIVHGCYMSGSFLTEHYRRRLHAFIGLDKVPKLKRVLQTGGTFTFVAFTWILFRVPSVQAAGVLMRRIFTVNMGNNVALLTGSVRHELLIAVVAMLMLESLSLAQKYPLFEQRLAKLPLWPKVVLYHLLIFIVVIWGKFNHAEFIYFQF